MKALIVIYHRVFWFMITINRCHHKKRKFLFIEIIHSLIQSVLPKGRSFTANTGTKIALLPKAGDPLPAQEQKLQFY